MIYNKISKIDMNKNKLTPTMKDVLLLLREAPRTDSELLAKIPNFSLELLGKLRDMEAIDHYDHLVYITSIGEKSLGENIVEKEK